MDAGIVYLTGGEWSFLPQIKRRHTAGAKFPWLGGRLDSIYPPSDVPTAREGEEGEEPGLSEGLSTDYPHAWVFDETQLGKLLAARREGCRIRAGLPQARVHKLSDFSVHDLCLHNLPAPVMNISEMHPQAAMFPQVWSPDSSSYS